jgi:hypothetical protein
MRRYVIALTVAASVAAVPTLASADSASDPQATCMKAFVATLPSKDTITQRIESMGDFSPPLGTSVDEYLLMAREARSDRVITQAVCTFDRAGRTILTNDPPTIAAHY